MKIGLTEQNCTRILQSPDNLGVFGGNPVPEQLAGSGRPNGRCIDVILQGDGNPVERASPPSPPLFRLRLSRGDQSLFLGDGDEGIQ